MKKVILGIALVAMASSVNFCGVKKYAEKAEAAQEECVKEAEEAYAENACPEAESCLEVALF